MRLQGQLLQAQNRSGSWSSVSTSSLRYEPSQMRSMMGYAATIGSTVQLTFGPTVSTTFPQVRRQLSAANG